MFHRRAHKLINIAITLCIFGFVVIFLKGPSTGHPDQPYPSFDELEWAAVRDMAKGSSSVNSSSDDDHKNPRDWRTDMAGWKFHGDEQLENMSITGDEVIKSVIFLNKDYTVLNTDKFGPVGEVKTVIVIQVHNRLAYLHYLIESLRNTKGIEDCLLVFSHDINISPINDLISNITFARVYQIFYPLNMQLFPSIFPGQDPRDCPEKIGKAKAQAMDCQNWNSSDKYGNYRRAQLTQIKHHWWWKMNYVFDGIIDRFNLPHAWVLLLEEDHYVAPDALHVLNYITQKKEKLCALCDIISLGFYLKSNKNYGKDVNHLGAHPWFSSKHNMGMALKKETWTKIKNCSEMFCTYDDYNWDWSVMQVTVKCLPQRFRVLFAKSPRVLHIGDCGVHTHRCDANKAYKTATDLLEKHKDKLFPSELVVNDVSRRSLKPSKPNGGWGDSRDHALCRLNTSPLQWKDQEMAEVLLDLLSAPVVVPNVDFHPPL